MSFLFPSPRVLTVTSPAIPQVAGAAALVPLKLSGFEALNTLFEYSLILQSPDALQFAANAASNFPLADMVGREITCTIELEGHGSFVAGLAGNAGAANRGAGVREISGLITAARHLGTDSRHALYELTLRPWLHLATLTSDCKVFQDQTPVEVIRAVLADYAFAAEVRLIETYPVRDYCVQYNETDFEFITRLMQEWGINYHFEHSGGVHRLILSDHNGAFSPLQKDKPGSAYHRIAYYPPGHKVDEEYIHAFTPTERLTAGQYASREYDYTRPKVALGASQAQPRPTGQASQEVYLWRGGKVRTGQTPGDNSGIGGTASGSLAGSDYAQENKGASKGSDTAQANQTEAQGQHLARLRMQALRQAGPRASGAGHVRGIAAGHTFSLHKHPQDAANTEYLTLSTHTVIENVSEDTARGSADQASKLLAQALPAALSDAQRLSGQWRIEVSFEVQPATELLRPEGTQPKPHTHGPETALVCGPDADTAQSDIYTDPLGRIKVQFPWDRYGPKNHNSSCWVRVSAAWAGNQLGAMHVPRIGQEVIVDFLGGDPDQPICTGRVYNQMNTPPWALPAQQALSGFRSRELKPGGGNSAAGRSNHLVLDDTEQKIQAQIKSDHDHSQLSLGHITRIEDNQGRKDHRGEGFELRTDGHGAVRAKDGLILSTEGRPNASGHITDLSETTARLAQGQSQHEALSQLASGHQAQEEGDQDAVAQALKEQNKAIAGESKAEGKFPELSEPHLILASPAGIESTTAQSTHQHSGQHHAITSGGHSSVSAGKSWLVSAKEAIRLFAYKAGIKLIAAGADVEVKSLSQNLSMLAKLDITHTANRIEINAKEEVLMNGGGSYRRWSASGIEEGTSGSWTAHAAGHDLNGPANASVLVQVPPVVPALDRLEFTLQSHPIEGDVLPLEPYEILRDGAVVGAGISDAQGGVSIDHQPGTGQYEVRLGNGVRYQLMVQPQFAAQEISRDLSSQGFRNRLGEQSRSSDYPATQVEQGD